MTIVIGFAAQRTLGNFVAGILIAISQPLRLGDDVEVSDVRGIVEEIGLTYTFIRCSDDTRLVIPNEKLASDTIQNSTIRGGGVHAVSPSRCRSQPICEHSSRPSKWMREIAATCSCPSSPTTRC